MSLKLALATALTATFFVAAVFAVGAPSKCPQVTPMTNFIPIKANGQWFVQLGSTQGTNNLAIKCEMRTLTAVNNGQYITVNVAFLRDDDDGEAFNDDFLLAPQTENTSYLDVLYSSVNNTQIAVDTDYATYAVWVDCFQIGDVAGYNTVAMTRDKQMSDTLKDTVLEILANNNLDNDLHPMAQTGCRKLP